MVALQWEEGDECRPGKNRGGGKARTTSSQGLHARAPRAPRDPGRAGPGGLGPSSPRREVLRGSSTYLPFQKTERDLEGGRNGSGERASRDTSKARSLAELRSRGGDPEGRGVGGVDQAERGTAPRPGCPLPFENDSWAPPQPRPRLTLSAGLDAASRPRGSCARKVVATALCSPHTDVLGPAGAPEAKGIRVEAPAPACRCLRRKPLS